MFGRYRGTAIYRDLLDAGIEMLELTILIETSKISLKLASSVVVPNKL